MRATLGLARRFVRRYPEKAAVVLEQLPSAEVAGLMADLGPADAAALLVRLSATLAADCLRALPERVVGPVLEVVPVDFAARALLRAGAEDRERWLGLLSAERARALRRQLSFPPGTAGALVDPLVLALPADLTVAEAHKYLRRAGERAYYYLYVVDREQRLVGALDLRELFLADGKQVLGAVMQRDVVSVPAHVPVAGVLVHPGWRSLDALPVVGGDGVFVGIIRHRTIRQLAAGSAVVEVHPALRALLSLGELYWIGASRVLSAATIGLGGRAVGGGAYGAE